LTLVLWRFYAPRLSKEGRAVFACATATVVFLVATTRIYLGVHYLSDVVAGILLGAAVGSLVPST
jgi:undecaprenyl-diphosphatase